MILNEKEARANEVDLKKVGVSLNRTTVVIDLTEHEQNEAMKEIIFQALEDEKTQPYLIDDEGVLDVRKDDRQQ